VRLAAVKAVLHTVRRPCLFAHTPAVAKHATARDASKRRSAFSPSWLLCFSFALSGVTRRTDCLRIPAHPQRTHLPIFANARNVHVKSPLRCRSCRSVKAENKEDEEKESSSETSNSTSPPRSRKRTAFKRCQSCFCISKQSAGFGETQHVPFSSFHFATVSHPSSSVAIASAAHSFFRGPNLCTAR